MQFPNIADMAPSRLLEELELSYGQLAGILALLWTVYLILLAVYRLWFSPISHVPGPTLAALTVWYETYYDIWLGGQYTFRIMEMHKKYGPVVRISPWEVHVADHDFHSELYTGPTRNRGKWQFWVQQFATPYAALTTLDHDHHKIRRAALNPYFSMAGVRKLQPVIEDRANALMEALDVWTQREGTKPLDVMYPFSAYTYDVINEYAFARCEHSVEKPDFDAAITDSMLIGSHMGPLLKHWPWAMWIILCLPEALSGRWIPGWAEFLNLKNNIAKQIAEIKNADAEKWEFDISHRTVFHDMLSSELLSPAEKTPERLANEGRILVQGGSLTSSWTMSVIIFHLLNRPSTLRKLRDAIFEAMPDGNEQVPLAKLENIPYLRAVILEGLRLAVGTSGRLPRVAPKETLVVGGENGDAGVVLPPGTVISMSPIMTVMSPEVFPDPEGFYPERWLDDGERLNKYLHVFGGGSRICLGRMLAQAELYVGVAKFFRRWGSAGVVDGSDDGDQRPGDVGFVKLYKTTPRDTQVAADYFIGIPYEGSQGIRLVFEHC